MKRGTLHWGVLVGDGDTGLGGTESLLLVDDPEAALVGLGFGSIYDGPGP